MAFIYDDKNRAAVDPIAGISMRGTHRFIDDSEVFSFEYRDRHLAFEFYAKVRREKRAYSYRGKSFDRAQEVAFYILEPTIRLGYAKASQKAHPDNRDGGILSDTEYCKLKVSIQEGMSVLGTAG